MKKLILISIIVLGIIGLYFLFKPSSNVNNDILDYKLNNDNKMISIMLEKDAGTGNYEKSNEGFPTKGYIFNKELSKCVNGSEIDYENNEVVVKATGTDKCYAYFDKATLANTCVDKEVGTCFSGNANLDSTIYFHDENLAGGAQDDSYRYAGTNEEVNNYVCLDGTTTSGACTNGDSDLYRIIGLFKNTSGQYETKLIKYDYATSEQLGEDGAYSKAAYSENSLNYKGNQENLASIGGYYWTSSSNQVNEWVDSALRETNLNGYYLETYLHEKKQIDTENLITTHTWSLNGHNDHMVTPKVMYDNEMDKVTGSPKYPTQTKTVNDKIGLMYESDYGYAASPSSTRNWTTNVGSYNNGSIPNNNWMYMGLNEWTISRTSGYSYVAFDVNIAGSVNYNLVYSYAYGVRPSFYINTDAKLKSGNGSKENPFRIGI